MSSSFVGAFPRLFASVTRTAGSFGIVTVARHSTSARSVCFSLVLKWETSLSISVCSSPDTAPGATQHKSSTASRITKLFMSRPLTSLPRDNHPPQPYCEDEFLSHYVVYGSVPFVLVRPCPERAIGRHYC